MEISFNQSSTRMEQFSFSLVATVRPSVRIRLTVGSPCEGELLTFILAQNQTEPHYEVEHQYIYDAPC